MVLFCVVFLLPFCGAEVPIHLPSMVYSHRCLRVVDMRSLKTYTVRCRRGIGCRGYRDITGTLPYLREFFGLDHPVTLVSGTLWKTTHVIQAPKGIKDLVRALNKRSRIEHHGWETKGLYGIPYFTQVEHPDSDVQE